MPTLFTSTATALPGEDEFGNNEETVSPNPASVATGLLVVVVVVVVDVVVVVLVLLFLRACRLHSPSRAFLTAAWRPALKSPKSTARCSTSTEGCFFKIAACREGKRVQESGRETRCWKVARACVRASAEDVTTGGLAYKPMLPPRPQQAAAAH